MIELRAYQLAMVDHMLAHDRCALFAGMGTGKTVATLTAIELLMLSGHVHKTLVLAPLRVAQSVWPAEVEKWPHLRHLKTSIISGTPGERRVALRRDADIYSINYENLVWLIDECKGEWPFDMVIADESTRLKGFRLRQGGKRAQALGKVAHRGPKRWVNLTGTPSPNGLVDLWGQTWFLDAGKRLGHTFTGFCERWFQTEFSGYGIRPLPYSDVEIHDRLADICLSVEGKDFFDLPEMIVNDIFVDLPKAARARYDDMEREMFTLLEGDEVEAFNAASRTIKCLQLANGAAYTDDAGTWTETHTVKLDALESVMNEAAGMPVLVAYNFISDRERILKHFKQARFLDKDPQTLVDWCAGKIPMLVLHPKSAGHGLNLQDGGNILAFFGVNWNLEEYLQVIERIGPVRQAQSGHDRPVYVHRILARDTVDELVLQRLDKKREVQDILLEAMKR